MYVKMKCEALPEELEENIDNYVNALNSGPLSLSESEMYRMEILTELNYCKREDLLPLDTISELRKYYVKEGILSNNK